LRQEGTSRGRRNREIFNMLGHAGPFASEGNRDAANALFDCVKAGRSIALVGAGISISAGYSSWNELLMQMEAAVARTSPFYRQALQSLRNSNDPLWRAQELRRQLGDDRYFGLLREIFRPKAVYPSPLMVDGLVNLPFRQYLTTNFDSLLEEAILRRDKRPATTIDCTNESDVSEFLFRLQDFAFAKCVVHLHGRYNDPVNIVLTDRDYTARYQTSTNASQKLISIFATQGVVFVGFSLTDPALSHLLRQTKLALGTGSIRHFAILGLPTWNDTDESVERYRLSSLYGIEPVFYPVESNHGALQFLIDFLNKPTKDGGWVPPDDDGGSAPGPGLAPGVAVVEGITPGVAGPGSSEDDPQRGRWGRMATGNDLEAVATVSEMSGKSTLPSNVPELGSNAGWEFFEVNIEVRPDASAGRKLRGRVRFHLHPTFVPATKDVRARDNKAILRLHAWGAFTVGIEVFDEPYTKLELNLAERSRVTAPERFFKT